MTGTLDSPGVLGGFRKASVSSTMTDSRYSSTTSASTTVTSPGYSVSNFSTATGYSVASGGGGSSAVGGNGGGGLTRQDSTASTIGGLRYGSESESEDDEDGTFTVPSTGTFPMPPTHVFPISSPLSSPPPASNAAVLRQLSPTSSQFSSTSSMAGRPIPQRSQSYSSLLSQKSQGSLSPTAHIFPPQKSPTSPTFSHPHPASVFSSPSSQHSGSQPGAIPRPPRERRPSNAPSLAPSLAASTASWEGDIYDDYRYSRYSVSSSFGGSLGRNGGKRFSSMSALSAAAGEMGSPEIPPVPERKDSYGDSIRGSMDSQRDLKKPRERVDSGESIDSQRIHPLSVFHRREESDASVYTQGSRVSAQPSLTGGSGFGSRSRLEDVVEISVDNNDGKEKGAATRSSVLGGSLRSSPSIQAASLRSSPSLQATSLRSSPSLQAASLRSSPASTLRSRSNSTATTLEGGTRSRSSSTAHRPPPLALTTSNVARADSKSNAPPQPSTATTNASSATPTAATTTTSRDSSSSTTSSNDPNAVLTTGSPLLHATWGSPLSSPTSSMGAGGTTAGLGSAVGASGFGFVTSPTGGTFRGAASAMRQMLEEKQRTSPKMVNVGEYVVERKGSKEGSVDMRIEHPNGFAAGNGHGGTGNESMDESGFGKRGIVMDDDEELPSHVRVDDSYTTADESNTTLLYDSSPPRIRIPPQGEYWVVS
jgi:trimeric autotransporter adhesin